MTSPSLFQSVVLGIVQGLTEFLPISSTAHLRIVPALAGWADPGAAFSAVIQIGTLIAVMAYFRRDLWRIGGAWLRESLAGQFGQSLDGRMGWMMIGATVPIVVLALLLQQAIRGPLRSLYIIGGALIALALVLAAAEWVVGLRKRRGHAGKTLYEVTGSDALLVGLAQAVALVPGASRSGVTITGALLSGLSREAAARFSFLLSIPAVLAAGLHQLASERHALLNSREDAVNLLVATVVSGLVGYASIAFLIHYLKRHSTWVFVIYRIVAGALILYLVSSGRLPAFD